MSTDEVMARWRDDLASRPLPDDDAPGPASRVRFGQLPSQTMPVEWAEDFIRIIYAEHPAVFRSVLPRCAGLPAEAPKRTRKPQ